jgi:hypothetical protein
MLFKPAKWVSLKQTGGALYRLYVCSHLRKSVIDFPNSRFYFFVDRVNGSTAGIFPGAWFPWTDWRSTSLLTARGGWINAS